MSSPDSTLSSNPHLVGIIHFFPEEKKVNVKFPLSIAFQGKRGLGKSQCMLPYAKGQFPRLPALSASRYLPVDDFSHVEGPSLVASNVQ